jgi:hypothetical protein
MIIMGVVMDICMRVVDMIPLDDHLTISALTCAHRACAGLLARFLRVNNVIDTCTLAQDAAVDFGARMHGMITRVVFSEEWDVLRHTYNVHAPLYLVRSNLHSYTMQFAFGRLVHWRDYHELHKFITIAGELVEVAYTHSANGTVGLDMWITHPIMRGYFLSVMSCEDVKDSLSHHCLYNTGESRVSWIQARPEFLVIVMIHKTRALQYWTA